MLKRDLKRLILSVLFFLVFFLFSASFYFLVLPEPSCLDGKRNQGEENIDCGGPCKPCKKDLALDPMQITDLKWVFDIDDKYDAYLNLKNPNDFYGAANFKLLFTFRDAEDQIISEQEVADNFILPGQVKDIVIQGLVSPQVPAVLEVSLVEDSVNWVKFESGKDVDFIINNKKYILHKDGSRIGYSSVEGELINQGSDAFREVMVVAVLYDKDGKLLAVNSQLLGSILPDEQRNFRMTFFHEFPGQVSRLVIKAYSNILNESNQLIDF